MKLVCAVILISISLTVSAAGIGDLITNLVKKPQTPVQQPQPPKPPVPTPPVKK